MIPLHRPLSAATPPGLKGHLPDFLLLCPGWCDFEKLYKPFEERGHDEKLVKLQNRGGRIFFQYMKKQDGKDWEYLSAVAICSTWREIWISCSGMAQTSCHQIWPLSIGLPWDPLHDHQRIGKSAYAGWGPRNHVKTNTPREAVTTRAKVQAGFPRVTGVTLDLHQCSDVSSGNP